MKFRLPGLSTLLSLTAAARHVSMRLQLPPIFGELFRSFLPEDCGKSESGRREAVKNDLLVGSPQAAFVRPSFGVDVRRRLGEHRLSQLKVPFAPLELEDTVSS